MLFYNLVVQLCISYAPLALIVLFNLLSTILVCEAAI